ncbi:cAMP-binding domain of CRP or a regulatory subunit of cAMP-dependent protein kinases [Variovorax sp. HW608]|uniref:Crp/Fnr family transcriptional regulator n=1 Tax=Variovorax sp. HW608 TaxID=1034889 RepID=UPI00081FEC63|nr:Crp/Fnr family transcriptional regulator [Variovorax sp. HW608]SCK60506.1 cAMP-binding domain of CRP or a regulatory subunit of cAMP-dependent protein kinases [Variovorax sp. HW608]
MSLSVVPEEPPVSAWLTALDFDWDEITRGYRRQAIANDALVFSQGWELDSVYVVQSGRLRLTADSVDGRKHHLMFIGPSGLAGDCGLFLEGRRYLVSAEAATDAVVCAVPAASFMNALQQSPALMRQFAALSALRFRIMLQHHSLLGANSARRRVCHHLLGLMGSYGVAHPAGTLIEMAFTKQEMGDLCALSRVSVSQILTQLAQDGVVAEEGRLLVVRAADRLVELART